MASDAGNLHDVLDRSLLRRAKETLTDFFGVSEARAAVGQMENVISQVVFSVLERNGEILATDMDILRSTWRKAFETDEVEHILNLAGSAEFLAPEEAAAALTAVNDRNRRRLLKSLWFVVCCGQLQKQKAAYFATFAKALEIGEAELSELLNDAEAKATKRRKLLKSGTGIIVSLIVLVVFIMAATWLAPVVFGLLLAYLMLPLEEYFERRIKKPGPLWKLGTAIWRGLLWPVRKARKAMRRAPAGRKNDAARRRMINRHLVDRATSLTALVLLVIVLMLGTLAVGAGLGYFNNVKAGVKRWAEPVQVTNAVMGATAGVAVTPVTPDEVKERTWENIFSHLQESLENQKKKFEKLPWVNRVLEETSKVIDSKDAQKELIDMVLKKTGGFFAFVGRLISLTGAILLNVLLTAFFFLLFLNQLAMFQLEHKEERGDVSGYLVRAVFNGNWLPGADPDTISEAERIVGEVIQKMKTFVRGYLSLVLVDFTVYSVVFYLLGVPYFLILGAIAGCGILLPFLGPIASAGLTLLVTLAVEGSAASIWQIVGIIGIYLLHNGITEQFILYPRVIGGSLGLSTLETIIVVLLGALLGGVAGMILAIPAAAVLKYLIPQIYNCWK